MQIGEALGYESFRSPTTNNTFTLYTTPMNFSAAQATCNSEGGHLASFSDLQEQVGRRAAVQSIMLVTGCFQRASCCAAMLC